MRSPSTRTPIGARRHWITLDAPVTVTADGDGGDVKTWAPLTPAGTWAAIVPATARDLERVAANTVTSTATHILTMRYHAGVTTQTRVTFGTRVFSLTGVSTPEERNRDTVAVGVEQVA